TLLVCSVPPVNSIRSKNFSQPRHGTVSGAIIMQLPVRSSDPKRILLILHGSIGDVTRALPLATVLRKGFPRSYIAWSVEPASRPLLEHNPAIDQIILFDRVRGWRALAPFLRQIREKRFDLVLDLQRILKSGLISWATGAPRRIGFNRADA